MAISRTKIIFSWVCSGLATLFLLMDSIIKIISLPVAVETSQELGYQASIVPTLGIILLLCAAFYLIPKTSVIGAVLLTAYFGGAIATHLRVENPLFSHVLFPVYLAIFVWAGLIFRNPSLKKYFLIST